MIVALPASSALAQSTQQATPPALTPARIASLTATLRQALAQPGARTYAVIAKFVEDAVQANGVNAAGAVASLVIAVAQTPGSGISDTNLGDGLAHASVAFGVHSAAARQIAIVVAQEASLKARKVYADITKALTGDTTLADLANSDFATVGDIGAPNGNPANPFQPGNNTCLNPSCTAL